MKNKKLLIALSVLVGFFGLVILIAVFKPPREATEETKRMLKEIESNYSSILAKFPSPGEEEEFALEGKFENIGYLEGGFNEYNIFICEEDEFSAMAKGSYNSVDLETYRSMSSGKFVYLDPNYFKERKSYYDFEYENDLTIIYGAKNIGVFRTEEKYTGDWLGEVLLERAWFKGWFFLLDLPSGEIIGCKRLDVMGGSEVSEWEGDHLDPLQDDLNQRVVSKANAAINEWCGTIKWPYFSYFKPEELNHSN